MEKVLKELCQFISELALQQETINECKLSPVEVRAMMEMIDVKKKGFLDLDDVYELVGKVTQEELFAIFKFLDTSRNGQIRIEQLNEAIGDPKSLSKNTTKEHIFPKFYKIVDTVKDKAKTIAECRKKYSFENRALKQVYEYICKLVQTKYLSYGQIITVVKSQSIKYGIKWTNETQSVIKDLFPGHSISQAKFIDVFAKPQACSQDGEQVLLNYTPISKFYTATANSAVQTQKIQQKSPIRVSSKADSPKNSVSKYQEAVEQKKASAIYKKTNNFLSTHLDTPSFQNISVPDSPKQKSSDFDKMEGNINNILDNIAQRRQKLRQDSLQRKKLIQDVMQRKKASCGLTRVVGSTLENRQQFEKQVNSSSNLKKSVKTYLNPGFNGSAGYNSINVDRSPIFYKQKIALREQSLNQAKGDQVDYRKYQQKGFSNELGSSYLISRNDRSQVKCVSRQNSNLADCKHENNRSNIQCAEISDLMKNYYRENKQSGDNSAQDANLKQLAKSKSGFISTSEYDKYFDKPNQNYRGMNKTLNRGDQYTSSCNLSVSVKQNVLRRAEEQAAKKIEEIERKARMKVLQKRNAMGRGHKQETDWGRVIKRGINY